MRGSVLVFLGATASVWIACSSTSTGPAAPRAPLWFRACTLDAAAEPPTTAGYQRCSDAWVKEKNAGKPCVPASECEAEGGVCAPGNGLTFYDPKCYARCNPTACPEGAGTCLVCEGQQAHCEISTRTCRPPSVPQVNGRGEACLNRSEQDSCTDTEDCCNHFLGMKATCLQSTYDDGRPITNVKPTCHDNCETDTDCDARFGESAGYCCVDVSATKVPGFNALTYTPVGTPNGTKRCATQQVDSRCRRVPGSSSSGGDCNYEACVSACTQAGGSNCADDCRC